MEPNRLFELADELKALREKKAALDDALTQVKIEIDNADWHLAQLMAEQEIPNFTRAGKQFVLTNRPFASAEADKKPDLYRALKTNGYGDMVYETVNANTLTAFVKERMNEHEGELPDWLIGLVRVFPKTTVAVKNAAKK